MVDIFKLSDSIRNLPIEGFHLPIPVYNKLKAAGINNLEQLLNPLRAGNELLNKVQKEKVRSTMTSFHLSMGSEGEPDWLAFCEKEGIAVVPQESPVTTDAEIFENLRGTIQEMLTFGDADERKWKTVQYRFALNEKTIMTLDDIGQAFGKITREAVRLIEKKSLAELRNAFLDGNRAGMQYRVDERVTGFVRNLRDLVANSGPDYATESELFAMISDFIGSQIDRRDEALLRLLFCLFEFTQIRELPEALPNVWKLNAAYPEAKLQKALTLVASSLTPDYLPPLDEFELLARVNRKMRRDQAISSQELSRILGLCDLVESTDDGQIQAKFEYIGSRVGQAERLLVEAGKPLSIGELVREMNRRLHAVGQPKLELFHIANVMSSDSRFIAVGKSGLRGLARWENVEVKSIVDVMEDALMSFNRPANAEEVFAYVNERRPASRNSVKIYLDTQKRFLRTGPKEWGLATWAEASRLNAEYETTRRRHAPRQRRTETKFERSVTAVREYFEHPPQPEVPLADLVLELVAKLALSNKTAYQYISRMRFIEKIQNGSSRNVCRLVVE